MVRTVLVDSNYRHVNLVVTATSSTDTGAGLKRRYMVSGGRLLEIQRVASATPASWFVDQSVKSGEM